MSSTFSVAEEEEKPRRLLGAKSLVVSGVAMTAAGQQAQAQFAVNTVTVSQSLSAGSVSLGTKGTSLSVNLTGITQLNVAAADLIGVTFSYSGGISQSAQISVPASTSSLTGTVAFNDTLTLTSNSGLFTTTTLSSINQTSSYACGNHTLSAGVCGFSYSPGNATASGTNQVAGLINVQSPGLNNFAGTGNLGLSLALKDNSSFSGSGGNTAFNASTTAGSVSVVYTYVTGSDRGGLLTNGSFGVSTAGDTEIVGPTGNGNLASGGYLYGNASAGTGFKVSAATINSLPGIGWTFSSIGILQKNGSAWGFTNSPDGDQTAVIQGTGTGISQNFTTGAKGFYKLTFYLENRPGTGSSSDVEVTVGGVTLNATANGYNSGTPGGFADTGLNSSTGDIAVANSTTWTEYLLYTQQLNASTAYNLAFVGGVTNSSTNIGIASVNLTYSYSSVPGPSSLAIFITGGPILLMAHRRRKVLKKAA